MKNLEVYYVLLVEMVELALQRHFRGGHAGSSKSIRSRYKKFIRFSYEQGVIAPGQITKKLVMAFCEELNEYVNEGTLSYVYAKNVISALNIVHLHTLKKHIHINPRDVLDGHHTQVRTTLPYGLDINKVSQLAARLSEKGFERHGIIILMCRLLGMRFREATMQNYIRLEREAKKFSYVNIIEGTKGGRGRTVDRWVPVDIISMQVIQLAAQLQGHHKFLIHEANCAQSAMSRVRYRYNQVRGYFDCVRIHDLRACFACDMYQILTNHKAPIINGRRTASKQNDKIARQKITQMLGHNRIGVVASYIGSSR